MSAKAKTRALTPKQEAFAAEYVRNGGNALQAAKKAYPNQTDGSAQQQGWENLRKPEIAKAIREGIEITFKNMGGSNGTSGNTTQDA